MTFVRYGIFIMVNTGSMERMKWVDRRFHFDVPPGWMLNVIGRLAGTEARLRQLVAGLSEAQLEYKPEGKWSIKEHIGHLSDLETLHEGRLQDFRERKEVLRAADMQNIATEQAQHNRRPVAELLTDFIGRRTGFIVELKKLDDATQRFISIHPRLQIPMKPVDMATFTAEHDDHHLATIMAIAASARVD